MFEVLFGLMQFFVARYLFVVNVALIVALILGLKRPL